MIIDRLRLDDRTVLVAGAGGAIGSIVAQRLAEAGARLVLVDNDAGRLDALGEALGEARAAHVAEVMKLRGANGRFRPCAIQTRPPRMSTIPMTTRRVRTHRSYSSEMYLRSRGGLWILRASKPRPSGAKPSPPLPTPRPIVGPGQRQAPGPRRHPMRRSTWFQLNSWEGST